MVPRPPTLIRPNRLKGAEHVVMFGVTFRITITLDGSVGTSFEVIVRDLRCDASGGDGISMMEKKAPIVQLQSYCMLFKNIRRAGCRDFVMHR